MNLLKKPVFCLFLWAVPVFYCFGGDIETLDADIEIDDYQMNSGDFKRIDDDPKHLKDPLNLSPPVMLSKWQSVNLLDSLQSKKTIPHH